MRTCEFHGAKNNEGHVVRNTEHHVCASWRVREKALSRGIQCLTRLADCFCILLAAPGGNEEFGAGIGMWEAGELLIMREFFLGDRRRHDDL